MFEKQYKMRMKKEAAASHNLTNTMYISTGYNSRMAHKLPEVSIENLKSGSDSFDHRKQSHQQKLDNGHQKYFFIF